MGIAAHNRGSRVITQDTDNDMAAANARAEWRAIKDENARLRERVAALERDLRRARRCLAAERHGREQLRERLAAEERAYAFVINVMAGIARRARLPGWPSDDHTRHD